MLHRSVWTLQELLNVVAPIGVVFYSQFPYYLLTFCPETIMSLQGWVASHRRICRRAWRCGCCR